MDKNYVYNLVSLEREQFMGTPDRSVMSIDVECTTNERTPEQIRKWLQYIKDSEWTEEDTDDYIDVEGDNEAAQILWFFEEHYGKCVIMVTDVNMFVTQVFKLEQVLGFDDDDEDETPRHGIFS